MLSAPIHVMVSMRVKTEWVADRDEKTGKTSPRNVGLQPVMRDGIEYEFDICGELDRENTLVVTKSRCSALSGGVFPKPGLDLATRLSEWLDGPPDETAGPVPPDLEAIWSRMSSRVGATEEFDGLHQRLEELLGPLEGAAEFTRILSAHG